MLVAQPRNRTGDKGQDGIDGVNGLDGRRGSFWTSYKGKPKTTLITLEYDQHLDSETGDTYQFLNNKWTKTGNIKGEKGDKGEKGKDGRNGAQWLPEASTGGSGVATQAPKLIATFNTDIGTQAGDLVVVNGNNTVTKITDNSPATMPNGIFGVGFNKPSSFTIEVIFIGIKNGFAGLSTGIPLFVSTSGVPTHTVPTTGMVQQIGFAVSATEIFFQLMQPMRRS
jgi:hypothetical protein